MVVHHWFDDGMVMYHRRSLIPGFLESLRAFFAISSLWRFPWGSCGCICQISKILLLLLARIYFVRELTMYKYELLLDLIFTHFEKLKKVWLKKIIDDVKDPFLWSFEQRSGEHTKQWDRSSTTWGALSTSPSQSGWCRGQPGHTGPLATAAPLPSSPRSSSLLSSGSAPSPSSSTMSAWSPGSSAKPSTSRRKEDKCQQQQQQHW